VVIKVILGSFCIIQENEFNDKRIVDLKINDSDEYGLSVNE